MLLWMEINVVTLHKVVKMRSIIKAKGVPMKNISVEPFFFLDRQCIFKYRRPNLYKEFCTVLYVHVNAEKSLYCSFISFQHMFINE